MTTGGVPVASDVKHPAPTTTMTNTSGGHSTQVVETTTVSRAPKSVDPVITETSLADVDYFYALSATYEQVGQSYA